MVSKFFSLYIRQSWWWAFSGIALFLFCMTYVRREHVSLDVRGLLPVYGLSGQEVKPRFDRAHYNKLLSNCVVPNSSSWDQYFDFIETVQECDEKKAFGGRPYGGGPLTDGDKWLCMDGIYGPRRGNCTVLSFGINGEWTFDDAMDEWGCKVYAFDPTMGKSDYNRSANIQFYNLGLGYKKSTVIIRKKPSQIDSYRGILTRLGLLDTTIDYLKIDIEGFETAFFRNILNEEPELLANVKQIGMEIHHGHGKGGAKDLLWHHLHRLRCASFVMVSSEMNRVGGNPFKLSRRQVSACYELVWINERFQ